MPKMLKSVKKQDHQSPAGGHPSQKKTCFPKVMTQSVMSSLSILHGEKSGRMWKSF